MLKLHAYINTLSHESPTLSTFIQFVFPMTIGDRKVLLKASRIGGPFSITSRFYTRHEEALTDKTHYMFSTTTDELDLSSGQNLWEIITRFSILFSHPVLCGFVSMAVRYLPYLDYYSVEEEKLKTVAKELEASQGGGFKAPWLEYSSLASYAYRTVPYRPGTAGDLRIGSCLRGGIRRLSSTPIYPRLGSKNIPLPDDYDTTYKPYESANGGPIRTVKCLERVYLRTGVELHGRTRMKTVWRGNDLKPRVYYSRGASLHRATCYIQQIFNALVDSLDNVHRHNRHNTSSLKPDFDEFVLIYDYSSFTSQLGEIHRFTMFLADMFRETEITIIDPHHGAKAVSLGDLLDEFNDIANLYPEFDASEILLVEEAVLNHNCGMLGVPGNISSCTLLHGIHLALLVQSIYKNRVVGDDAIALMKLAGYDYLVEGIRELGDVSEPKTERWNPNFDDEERVEERYDYKKRTINRIENTIHTGRLLDYPPMSLFGIRNPYHRAFPETEGKSRRKAIRSLIRFYDDLAAEPFVLSEEVISLVEASLIPYYKSLGLKRLGGIDTLANMKYPGICAEGLRYTDWIYRFSETIRLSLPVVYSPKEYPDSVSVGQVFFRKSSGFTSYLVAVGILEDETEYEMVPCKDLIAVDGSVSPRVLLGSMVVRKFTIVEEPLYWMRQSLVEEDTL